MKETVVELRVVSKKETKFNPGDAPQFSIELAVPYDRQSIFYQMSGGTTLNLNTINKEAAGMFEPGDTFEMVLRKNPVEGPFPGESALPEDDNPNIKLAKEEDISSDQLKKK